MKHAVGLNELISKRLDTKKVSDVAEQDKFILLENYAKRKRKNILQIKRN